MNEHGDRREQQDGHGRPQQEEERVAEQAGEREGERPAKPRSGPAGRRPRSAALIFDDPLDRRSADDSDTGWSDPPSGTGSASSGGRDLAWYLSEKPPHHGD
jgi:hypothetical protein